MAPPLQVGAARDLQALLASFDLENDAALVRLANLVHYLDIGGVPVVEARGLEVLLTGARMRAQNDDELFADASKMFDHLYQAYSQESPQHGI